MGGNDKTQPRCPECGQLLHYIGTFKGNPIYGHRSLNECKNEAKEENLSG